MFKSKILALFCLLIIIGCDLGTRVNDKEPPHTHSYGSWSTSIWATCYSEGEQQRSCACGYVETQSTAKLTGSVCDPSHTHNYSIWETTRCEP